MITEVRPLVEINQQAIRLLYKELGVIEAVRFLKQFTQGYGNYTQERDSLFANSLPYITWCLWQAKKEEGLKVQRMFQCVLEPVEPQAEETFVATIAAFNQCQLSFGQHAQTLHNHPNVSEASGNQ